MDKFLSGFGMSKLSVGGGKKPETSRSGSPASLSGAQNGLTETPPIPAKVSKCYYRKNSKNWDT